MRILEESGIGLPPYLKWGRTHSGCYFCFFQKSIEWVRLLEAHPEQFDQAQAYEKPDPDSPNGTFTWNRGLPLCELRKPENTARIRKRYAADLERLRRCRPNKTLGEVLGCWEPEDLAPKACLICQL